MKYMIIILIVVLISLNCTTRLFADETASKGPKNVIFMIGDGMGLNQVVLSNYYLYGKDSVQSYQKFPVKYFMSTYHAKDSTNQITISPYNSEKAWSDFDYLKDEYTDSAPAATALATGTKTYFRAIGVDTNYNILLNLTEYFITLNKSAGVVSSVPFSHATPAGFTVHNANRNNYSEIAEDMVLSKLDVIIGTGHPFYNSNGEVADSAKYKFISEETFQLLKDGFNGWKLIESKQDFEKLAVNETDSRIFGIPCVNETLQQERKIHTDSIPFDTPFNQNVPDLSTLTKVALNRLDNNPNGFFLMIEGGAIDWACHDNQFGRMVEEVNFFNQTVEDVIKWVETNSSWDETLLIVTGDHETGYITGPIEKDNNPNTNPVVNNGKGNIPGFRWNSDNHSNMLIPVYIMGKGSELFHKYADEDDLIFRKYIDNTEIFHAIIELNK